MPLALLPLLLLLLVVAVVLPAAGLLSVAALHAHACRHLRCPRPRQPVPKLNMPSYEKKFQASAAQPPPGDATTPRLEHQGLLSESASAMRFQHSLGSTPASRQASPAADTIILGPSEDKSLDTSLAVATLAAVTSAACARPEAATSAVNASSSSACLLQLLQCLIAPCRAMLLVVASCGC